MARDVHWTLLRAERALSGFNRVAKALECREYIRRNCEGFRSPEMTLEVLEQAWRALVGAGKVLNRTGKDLGGIKSQTRQ